ncbi:imidazole glycerol phosphate synthase subunit HisH [Vineibacter terrae]|uniref:Imidazole glycerol phosphate synthase subunit HisH n=1 Tax=Vineibacter terrae TaxID=2586908 RepID=A0A5C8PPW2_9HYPH|nr:imidazole glycerol phosphate synthase subunit HisH [Vineibacter terrae]TXL77074.1 imidazole glycerol phosphate synthase subunit HisH [Vineibacter terrae]
MPDEAGRPCVAIVDYGLGNLFSVAQACRHAGLDSAITSAPDDLWRADGVILPGVGAFGHAMRTLDRLGLRSTLIEVAAAGKPVVGICLGFQLLFSESCEFGTHAGLGIVDGVVENLRDAAPAAATGRRLKVPHVGWLGIHRASTGRSDDGWTGTLLAGVPDGAPMYFVHSFYARPARDTATLATARFGELAYCCAIQAGDVFGCQFHPERSGADGLRLYDNLARHLGVKAAAQSLPW